MQIVFDTETTGKYNGRIALDDDRQPDMVELAAIKRNSEREIIDSLVTYVIPQKPIDPGAEKVHGISMRQAQEEGISRKEALSKFLIMCSDADTIIAHNIKFDMTIMAIAAMREGMTEEFQKCVGQKKHFCTMTNSTNILKLKSTGYGPYKWPSLAEAYEYLVDAKGFEGAHAAMEDVKACASVFDVLEALGHVR